MSSHRTSALLHECVSLLGQFAEPPACMGVPYIRKFTAIPHNSSISSCAPSSSSSPTSFSSPSCSSKSPLVLLTGMCHDRYCDSFGSAGPRICRPTKGTGPSVLNVNPAEQLQRHAQEPRAGLFDTFWYASFPTRYLRDTKAKPASVVLVVDACHSGAWCDYFLREIVTRKLQQISLMLQTACGSDESSNYGGLSTGLQQLR